MKEAHIRPSDFTYNALIKLSPDLQTAEGWLKRMQEAGIRPDDVTYNTLIKLSPDLKAGEIWLKRMQEAGMRPDEFTYGSLIKLSPDLKTGEAWFKRMQEARLELTDIGTSSLAAKNTTLDDADRLTAKLEQAPGHVGQAYFSAIYSRLATYLSGSELLDWHFQQKYRWAEALGAAIRSYAAAGRTEDSFRIALGFPYLDAARKIFRDHGDSASRYYMQLLSQEFEPYNTTYALGVCFAENNRRTEALPMLKEALRLASSDKRKEHIRQMIHKLEDDAH